LQKIHDGDPKATPVDQQIAKRQAQDGSFSYLSGMSKNPSRRLHPAMLAATLATLLLAGTPGLILAQNVVPGGGIGPAPAPTPGQSISIGPGNQGGGIGPTPAPTPGQSISIAPGNLGGGVGPEPAPTPGQSISIAPNTRRGRGVATRRTTIPSSNAPSLGLGRGGGAPVVDPGLRQTFRRTANDRTQPPPDEAAPPHKRPKKCLRHCAHVPQG
jgi:hypothetical protein